MAYLEELLPVDAHVVVLVEEEEGEHERVAGLCKPLDKAQLRLLKSSADAPRPKPTGEKGEDEDDGER